MTKSVYHIFILPDISAFFRWA